MGGAGPAGAFPGLARTHQRQAEPLLPLPELRPVASHARAAMTEERDRSEGWARRRTAFHESGHALVAHVLRRPPRLVSIRGTEHYAGITTHSGAGRRFSGDPQLHLPVILQPTQSRRALETSICIALAGSIAEELVWRETGYVETPPDDQWAELAARELAGLSARSAEALEKLETQQEPFTPDEVNAWQLSRLLADEQAEYHLSYMRSMTKSLVYHPTNRRLLEVLADLLLEKGVIAGNEVRELLQDALPSRPSRHLAVAASVTESPREGGTS